MLASLNGKVWERREHPRFVHTRAVNVSVGSWNRLKVWGIDISRGGIRLAMPEDIEPGDHVTVDIALPNELLLSLDAKVCHVRAGEAPGERIAGLQWIESQVADFEAFNAMIDDLETAAIAA